MKIMAGVHFDPATRRIIGFEEFNGLAGAELEFDGLIGKGDPQLAEHVLVFWFQTFAPQEKRQSFAAVRHPDSHCSLLAARRSLALLAPCLGNQAHFYLKNESAALIQRMWDEVVTALHTRGFRTTIGGCDGASWNRAFQKALFTEGGAEIYDKEIAQLKAEDRAEQAAAAGRRLSGTAAMARRRHMKERRRRLKTLKRRRRQRVHTYYVHPVFGHRIYFVSDFPHLIKKLRFATCALANVPFSPSSATSQLLFNK